MRTKGRDELEARVQQALALPTKKEAEHIVNTVIESLEATLLYNLGTNGFGFSSIEVSPLAANKDYTFR